MLNKMGLNYGVNKKLIYYLVKRQTFKMKFKIM